MAQSYKLGTIVYSKKVNESMKQITRKRNSNADESFEFQIFILLSYMYILTEKNAHYFSRINLSWIIRFIKTFFMLPMSFRL